MFVMDSILFLFLSAETSLEVVITLLLLFPAVSATPYACVLMVNFGTRLSLSLPIQFSQLAMKTSSERIHIALIYRDHGEQ
ncbi:hypothetical protein VTN00DRAFT_6342 [Thermoascus crustaceus]|uniref:uncharacterized protein n=1 Tax=Thermoascus crustaceus TaxID=5088 RepID=UPI00374286E5